MIAIQYTQCLCFYVTDFYIHNTSAYVGGQGRPDGPKWQRMQQPVSMLIRRASASRSVFHTRDSVRRVRLVRSHFTGRVDIPRRYISRKVRAAHTKLYTAAFRHDRIFEGKPCAPIISIGNHTVYKYTIQS